MRALGMYIYAGGFSLGMRKRFDIVAHLEDGEFGVETVRLNMPEINVVTDKEDWWRGAMPGRRSHEPAWDWAQLPIDVVYGNPPCAPWSVAGHSAHTNRRKEAEWYRQDPRTACTYDLFEALLRVRPKFWVWECVQALLSKGMGLIKELAAEAGELGYETSILKHDGYDCGVPQHRKRVFVVMHNQPAVWAAPTGGPGRTVGEVLAGHQVGGEEDVPETPSAWVEVLANTPSPGGLAATFNRLYPERAAGPKPVKGRPGFLHQRLSLDKPCRTCTGGLHLYHPTEDRPIAASEMAAFSGYPVDYKFVGRHSGDKFPQIARAVLPPTAEWLANELAGNIIAAAWAATAAPAVRPGQITLYDFMKNEVKVL